MEQNAVIKQYAVGFQGSATGMRAGDRDQLYLEKGTNLQLDMIADQTWSEGREGLNRVIASEKA